MAPNFLKDFALVSIQTEEQELKFDSTKLFITAFLSSDPKKFFGLMSALSWFEVDLEILLKCKLQLN